MRTRTLVGVLAAALAMSQCTESTNPVSPSPASGGGGDAQLGVEGGHGGRPFATELTGAAEVPGPGDPDGSGQATLTLNPGQGQVCFELTVTGIDPAVAAHIHVGAATVAGPIVVGLAPPTSGTSSGCQNADRALIADIIQNPGGYYVNVHTPMFPAGALRGQLGK